MSQRTGELQRAVIDEFRRIPAVDVAEYQLWVDLLKTSKALANNGAEADGASSRRDFIQKFHICLKESKECLQQLSALLHACPSRGLQLKRLWDQCNEITAILVASLKTAKKNDRS